MEARWQRLEFHAVGKFYCVPLQPSVSHVPLELLTPRYALFPGDRISTLISLSLNVYDDVGSALSLPGFDIKSDEEQGRDWRAHIRRSIGQLQVERLPSSSLYS